MKKKVFRRICAQSISLLLCVTFVLGMIPMGLISVFASNGSSAVAKVGDTEYDNYIHAWTAVKNGGTITMLNDWTTTEMLTVNADTAITINMNGYMINRNLTDDKESGEVFLIKNNGALTLNGNGVDTTEHWGAVSKNKWHYTGKETGNCLIKGSLVTGGYNEDGGAAIHIQEKGTVKITDVTIAGNACTDDEKGGAIRLQGANSTLQLVDSTVSYNKSKNGGGAAVWVEGKDSAVLIKNSKIHHNVVEVDYGDGGAIQINNGTVTVENSEISFNEAGRNGGAVYISNGNLVLDEKSVISYNTSNKEGGGIYVDKNADKVTVKGYFVGNYAEEEGGAIYVNSTINGENGVTVSDAEMMGNTSKGNGGAVYVDPDNDIALAGCVVIHGNSPNNLYIKSSENIKENNLSDNSRIGIYTSWEANKESPVNTTKYKYFFSDKVGLEITGTADSLYYQESKEGAPEKYNVGNEEYPLIKGTFSYAASSGGTMSPYFYYSDGYFAEHPKFYNEHLASLATGMALAAMTSRYEGEYTEEKASKNIADMFVAMGFSDIFIHYPEPEYFGKDSEILSTIGYAIAKKTVTANGKQTTIVATAVRGGGYGAEWASNVTLGSGIGEAQGFGDAAKQVKQGIDNYLTQKGVDTSNVKFMITGYSRAAATSNLVAKKLTDTYGVDRVYAYCFETPKGGVYNELKEDVLYTNIHNIVNRVDVVTTVGTTEMGFIRYGVDHILPAYTVGSSKYEEQKALMLIQLSAVNPQIEHNDYFHEATIEYILGIAATELIDENWYPDFDRAEDWIPFFIEKLQEYSLTDMLDKAGIDDDDRKSDSYSGYTKNNIFNRNSVNWNGYRNFWSDYEWYLYIDANDGNKVKNKCYAKQPSDFSTDKYMVLSIEDAVANLMDFYFGASSEKKESITKALDLGSIVGKIKKFHIYTVVVDEWNELKIGKKNSEFNDLWDSIEIEKSLKDVLSAEEMKTLKASMYVVMDFLLDFVADDYDKTDQDIVGTLAHNIGAILQTHYQDITYSWVRSYDSFYGDVEYVCPHEYSEWITVNEATETEYGVQKKVCANCGEELFEAIPALNADDDQNSGNENDTTAETTANSETTAAANNVTASLIGTGSVVSIVCMSIALVACGVMVFFYMKMKNEKVSK